MSINQKYTWADFLREHPEARAKKLKRTSKEGKKAFEDAFKAHAKTYLKDLSARFEKDANRSTQRRDATIARLKATKDGCAAKVIQARVGQKDHAIYAANRQIERAKALAKSL